MRRIAPQFNRPDADERNLLVLLGDRSLCALLRPGLTRLAPLNSRAVVGLLPLGPGCDRVTTRGLAYNLDGEALHFGVRVSSCNRALQPSVTVETSDPLLWTYHLDADPPTD
eukprot:Selendium_serpulae@DN1789_c1_g1_i1.p2